MVLAAVADAAAHRTGGRPALVRLERSARRTGRGIVLPELPDVEGSVGCFRYGFPVAVERSEDGPAATLQGVKERVRSVPDGGLSWGLLRFGTGRGGAVERLGDLAPPRLGVSHLGSDALDAWEVRRTGPAATPVELRTRIAGGRLVLEWSFEAGISAEAVRSLAADTRAALVALTEAARDAEATPTDFPEADLDQAELDAVFSKLGG
jgi:non-ribosomal peptide synthase protein (TIGR01720 family)